MKADDKRLGEAVLRRLLIGADVGGVRFSAVLQLLVTDHRLKRQIYINLESRWAVFPGWPSAFPAREQDLPELEQGEQVKLLSELGVQTITDVRLGDEYPHLILTLESGQIFFLNGRHDQYETWQCGIALGDADEEWMVVATPGGGLAVWAPEGFGSRDVR